MPRSELEHFTDIADPEIIRGRQAQDLARYVPFHWFARNPFEGRVQLDHPEKEFVLITVRRTLANSENWRIITQHPLANTVAVLLDYAPGFEAIDWATMNLRKYSDPLCKSICMAECLCPRIIRAEEFFKIYVPDERVAENVNTTLRTLALDLEVTINRSMFS